MEHTEGFPGPPTASDGQDRTGALGWGRRPNRPKTSLANRTITPSPLNVVNLHRSVFMAHPAASSHVPRQEPGGGTIRAWRGMGTVSGGVPHYLQRSAQAGLAASGRGKAKGRSLVGGNSDPMSEPVRRARGGLLAARYIECARPTGDSHICTTDDPAQRFRGAKLRPRQMGWCDKRNSAATDSIKAGAR
jgi:hypothetical protein